MRSILTRLRLLAIMSILSVALPMMSVSTFTQVTVAHAAGGSFTRLISSSGTAAFGQSSQGPEGLQFPEVRSNPSSDSGPAPFSSTINGGSSSNGKVDNSKQGLAKSFDGINHRQQRLADNGNQFSVEPPDQGLCVGRGFVMESINDALRVYDTNGNPLTSVVALNKFYGYPSAFVRPKGPFGPFVTDPSCYFDQPTQRWFQLTLTLDVDPATGNFLGPNHLDLAVSQTSDPTGSWTIYRIPVQDDGTQNTPNHHCDQGPCLGDYPHIGADKNGIYLTTNEYPFFGNGFHGAQIYAISKQALAANATAIAVTQIDTAGLVNGNPGFTVWPATTPGTDYALAQGGTEYFMSSDAASEANGNGASNHLIVWALTNTSSLHNTPSLTISNTVLSVKAYAIPPKADQKRGPVPLAECLNDSTCANVILGGPDPFAPEVQSPLDSNDTRMQQVVYVKGLLSGSLDTTLTVGGENKAGIEWFFTRPSVASGTVTARVVGNSYLGVAQNNVIYPAIGRSEDGQGIIAFTLVGEDFYPSAAYATISPSGGVGRIHVAAAGLGPEDGFSDYKIFGIPPGTTRPRWGDYGAAVGTSDSVWIASEYIGQRCNLSQYEAAPFGSCNGTRTALANWFTRISQIRVN